ncbi:MAG: TIGR02266 family protein [Myxococcaceae bacterium]
MRPLQTGGRSKENRKHKRVHSHARCWCEGTNVTFYSRVGNVSEGGLFVSTNTPLPPGAQTRIRLELSPAESLTVSATVVWARSAGEVGPAGMGLAFKQPDSTQQRAQISAFIAAEVAASAVKR